MKNLIITALVSVGLLAASPAFARNFACEGLTYDGDTVVVSGQFDRVGHYGNLFIDRYNRWGTVDNEYMFFENNYRINTTNTFWNITGFDDYGASISIRHPEGRSNETYMRIYIDPLFDHEFSRATCTFWGSM